MRNFTTLHDPVSVYVPETHRSSIDHFFLKLIADERNLPFAHLTLRISLTLIPIGVLLFMPFVTGWIWWALVLVYHYLGNVVFKGPFGLMLHCVSHRPLFKKEYDWLNQYLPWVVGPFFGQTPETYFAHHIGMHHAENNLHDDGSSTLHYQRDNLRDFLRYLANFLFLGMVQMTYYLSRKKRRTLMRRAIAGEVSFFVLCAVLCLVRWQAVVAVFIVPFLIMRVVQMVGNWTQHAFLDADDPGNPFKNSVTCINTKYNHKCWNDGYHASHHFRPAMHWTEHPVFFEKNLHRYSDNRAIVFEEIEFLGIFYHLMRKRYDKLARHFVNVNNVYDTEDQVIALLKERTRRIAHPVEA